MSLASVSIKPPSTEMKWHPIACIFPMLPDHELQELANDIREHGLREPVVMLDGKVLDGRNRWMACIYAGVEPRTIEYKGSPQDALAFVWSTNVHRRHLNSGQAAVALAKREKLDAEYAAAVDAMRKAAPKNQHDLKKVPAQKIVQAPRQERSTDHKLAESAGTNRSYVATARKVVEHAPALAEKVERGEITLSQASTEMRRDEKRKVLKEKAKAVETEDAFAGEPLWTLINQDVMDGLESVRDHHGPARLIFADPPYNIGIEYGDHHDDKMDDAHFVDWCLKWTRLACDCLTDDGSLWLMINDEYVADFVMNARDCGLTMRAWIKWYETFGVNCSNNFNRTSRHILYFVMDEDNFVFNETEVLRPSDRQSKYNDSRAQSSGKILDDVWQIPRLSGTSAERIPDFPTQLPIELVSRIVRVSSEPGDLVVDPFNGSGTTGVAALESYRKYIGIDASEKFIDLADMRLRGLK
jgi:DNA modification methylase/ParB-like chromosome segregation protein Spo0J